MKQIKCNKCDYFEIVNDTFYKAVEDTTIRCVRSRACEGQMVVAD